VRVVVFGAGGQLGAAIVHECTSSSRHDVVPFAHADLDIRDDAAVATAIERARPDAIVNCAAYNNVDAAEDHPTDALAINAFPLRAMARAAERAGAALVHYGTDFVFDGNRSTPYTENDPPAPRSMYAASKLLGEWFALDAPRAYVLRVESLFGRAPNGPPSIGSVASIVRTMREGGTVRVFDDRTVSPAYVPDIASATRRLLETSAPPGLYHCVNSGSCTWLEFAQQLARQLGIDARLTPVKMADVPLRAQRPLFSALSNDKLRRAGIEMPTWRDAIARFVSGAIADPPSAASG